MKKTLLARVLLPNRTFVTTWENITISGFTKQLNGGSGECIIRYAVPFDYDGADLREGNEVELIIADRDTRPLITQDGMYGTRTVYRGYISLIKREMDQGGEIVSVHLLGYYTLLGMDVLKSGS
jgi:hypothetical protein